MRLLVLAAVAAAMALPLVASAQTAPPVMDRAAVEKIVREYIVQNPEILLEAMQELRKRQEENQEKASVGAIKQFRAQLLENPADPVAGNPKGDVTVVEFFDYNCGYCKRVGPSVKKVLTDDPNVRLVYKELPILSEGSKTAAQAALAARKQGKYAQMHEALMASRGALDQARVMAIAAELKLDVAKLQKDMADPEIEAAIQSNLALAQALGVNGTPGFVIGDKLIPGAVDADTLKKAIADARTKRG